MASSELKIHVDAEEVRLLAGALQTFAETLSKALAELREELVELSRETDALMVEWENC